MLAKQCYRQTFSGEFISTIVRHTDVIVLHFSFWGRGTRTLHFRPGESSWNLRKKHWQTWAPRKRPEHWYFSAQQFDQPPLNWLFTYFLLRLTISWDWKTFPWLDAFSWFGKPSLSVLFFALYVLSNALQRSKARSCWDHSESNSVPSLRKR